MGQNLVAGILKNIENMANVNIQQNVSILTSIKKTNVILSKEIGKELVKQTQLLQAIANVLTKGDGVNKTSISLFGSNASTDLSKLFKKKGAKSVRALASSIDVLTTAITKFSVAINSIDEKKFKMFTSLFDMGKKIMLFSVFVALSAPLLAIGLVTTMPLLYFWVKFFVWVGEKAKGINRGAKMLLYMAMATGIIVASVLLSALALGTPLKTMAAFLIVALSLLVVSGVFLIISKMKKPLKKGANTMMWIAIATGIIVATILISAQFIEKVGWESILLVVGVLIVVALVYVLISKFSKKMKSGAVGMIFLALTTAIIVGILLYVAQDENSLTRLAKAGLVIGVMLIGLVLLFAFAGEIYQEIAKGAAAMLIVSIVVAIISYSLVEFGKVFGNGEKKEGWETIGMLSAFIVGSGAAFAAAGLVAPLIALGGAAMLIVAGAIWVFTDALVAFAGTKWTDENTESLSNAITKVVGALVTTFSDLSIVDFIQLGAGIVLMTGLGNALSAFAQGLSGFANLELSEVTENSDGTYTVTSKGSIDPQAISNNIALLIESISQPLIEFAEANSGGGLFGDGLLGEGIGLLGKLGNSLGSFAMGMAGFADMKFMSFNEKTGKVIPGTEKGINIKGIGLGIQSLISATTTTIEELGGKSGSWFNNSQYEDGLETLSNLGLPLSQLAETAEIFSKGKFDTVKIGKTIKDTIGSFVEGITGLGEVDDNAEDVVSLFGDFTGSLEKIKGKDATKVGDMFVKMKDSINGMELKKLNKLNDLAFNLRMFAENMDGSFGDLEDVLDRLVDVVKEMNGIGIKTPSTSSNTPSNTEVNIDLQVLVDELDSIKQVLKGGLEVEVMNDNMFSK